MSDDKPNVSTTDPYDWRTFVKRQWFKDWDSPEDSAYDDIPPAGLSAAQEIRVEALNAAVKLLADLNLRWPDQAVNLDSWVADRQLVDAAMKVVEPLTMRMADLIEHGADVVEQSPIAVWTHSCGQAFSSYGPHPDKCFACHQPGTWAVLGPKCCPRCHTPWQEHDLEVLKRCDALDADGDGAEATG